MLIEEETDWRKTVFFCRLPVTHSFCVPLILITIFILLLVAVAGETQLATIYISIR